MGRNENSSSSRKSHRRHSDDHRRKRRPSPESSDDNQHISEEKINQYLSKKAQKKAIRVSKKLKTSTVSGYTNESNPFGDTNLNETFVWRKKIDRDISTGVTLDEFTVKAEKRRQKERLTEIEKVKKRREERAVEKARREEEMLLLQRERAKAEADDFEKKEDEFHFEQSKVRSKIRLREGRMKPIDVLTACLDETDEFDVELDEPFMVFKVIF